MQLSILGSVAFDTLHTPEGTRKKIPGGSAFYSSIASSYFTKTFLISKVGNDYPKEYFELLKKRNIDISNVQISDTNKTFHWTGSYLKNINIAETITTEIGVLADYVPTMNKNAQNNEICFCANTDPISQRTVLEQSNATIKAIDTMNLWIDTMKEELEKTLTKVSLLFINDTELKMLTGEYNLLTAVRKIQKKFNNIEYLILKKGEYGSSIYSKKENEIFTTGSYPLHLVKDPTGAGDSFAGGFLGYLAINNELSWKAMKNALLIGTATSSFTVEEFGPDALLNTSQEKINSRYNQLLNFLKI
jgi:sugar/nucleoside kinase (ribokinase family)